MGFIFESKKLLRKSNLDYLILPLAIILSGFKLFGYSISFIVFLPFFLINFRKYFIYFKESTKQTKFICFFIFYMILMTIFGSFFINELKILLYWGTFFTVLAFIYIHNKILLENDIFYREKFNFIIYISGLIYFLIYLLMNFISIKFFGNIYDIQNDFWIGSSASFHIASIFLSSLYILWQKIEFKIRSHYFLSSLFFVFLVSFNSSRLGYLYFLLFSFFTLINCLSKKLFIRALLIGILFANTYFYSSTILALDKAETFNVIDTAKNINRSASTLPKILKPEDDVVAFKGDDDRIFELMVGFKKFKRLNIFNKFIGTGWYSSRKTINDVRNKMIQDNSEKLKEFKFIEKTNVSASLQGIVALILDMGLIGISLIGFLYLLVIKKLITYRDLLIRLFLISMLGMNAFCLLIGYPFANIVYWLVFLPGGIFQFKQDYPKT